MPTTRLDDFGKLPDGTSIPRYLLDNGRGLRAEVVALGGVVLRLFAPGRDGASANVLLGPATAGQIVDPKSPYLGALIGRVGNRIGHARFSLDGTAYTLAANDGPHTLHGGKVGYDKRLWQATPVGDAALKLSLFDYDATEGFPGDVRVEVTYTLTPENAWRIDYVATTDKATPINLTQHAYFNLKDAGRSPVLDHELQLHATHYTPSDAGLLPTGEIVPVAGTPFDYTTAKPIGRDFDKLTNTPRGVDHNFVIDGGTADTATRSDTLRPAAAVYEPTTGRTMAVWTTEPGVQVYTGNFLDGSYAGHDGFAYAQHTAFCLETQHYPDSPNRPDFPNATLRPGETFRSTTEYRFGTR